MAPLTAEELSVLERTLLPALERHHLRLLAHGLRTLQAIAGRRSGPLPEASAIAAWASRQEVIRNDPAFAQAFLDQMEQLAGTLVRISDAGGLADGPLALDLDDLTRWSLRQADARLAEPPPTP